MSEIEDLENNANATNQVVHELEDKVMALQLQVQTLQDKIQEHNEVLRKFRMLKV